MLRFLVVTILLALSSSSFAASKNCETVAQKAILKKFRSHFYAYGKRVRHFEGSSCRNQRGKTGNSYVRCDVLATTGDGAGDVSFQALLTEKCDRAFSTFITGEE